jgi:hypothetical protein
MNQFFFHMKANSKKHCIPHWVGGSCNPVFPTTEGHARSVLMRHRQWMKLFRKKEDSDLHVPEFHEFLESEACPAPPHEDGKTHVEPAATVVNDDFACDADEETRVPVDAVRNLPCFVGEHKLDDDDFDFGHGHNWGKTNVEVSCRIGCSAADCQVSSKFLGLASIRKTIHLCMACGQHKRQERRGGGFQHPKENEQ